jgi:hypothetical protein
MATSRAAHRPGTIIRGPDGALYFIPDKRMEAFRLPEKSIAPVQEFLDSEAAANADQPVQLHARRAVVQITPGRVTNVRRES